MRFYQYPQQPFVEMEKGIISISKEIIESPEGKKAQQEYELKEWKKSLSIRKDDSDTKEIDHGRDDR